MSLASDGIIYAVQAPVVDDYNVSIVLSPKRVISIDGTIINTEFDLPSNIASHSWAGISPENYPYWWRDAPLLEKLKIIENSEIGRNQFGAEFYISDLFEGKIYKVDALKNVEVLAQGLQFPSSLAVDSIGNIFYTTSPLGGRGGSEGWNVLNYKSSLNMLNPETGESVLLKEFDETLEDYAATGGWAYATYKGLVYLIPVGFNITNVLYEFKDKLEFLITNSLQGSLKYVSAEK